MSSGVRELEHDLERLVKSQVPITIVFGDDFHLTQSGALSRLMSIGCELRLYADEARVGYHPKLWIIDYMDDTRMVIVGSSNLSRGGLVSNAEASVVMHGTSAELDAFEEIWSSFADNAHEFTAADLMSYIDSETATAVPPPRRGRVSAREMVDEIQRHIERWQRFIAHPHRIGQSERWRGWYLVPEQGQLTEAKLKELGQILRALRERPQYRGEGMVSLGTDATGVANAVTALRSAGVTTAHPFSDRQRRDLFVRQQRLYLQTFHWLEEVDREHFRITRPGERFLGAQTDIKRAHLFTEAMSLKKWPFGPLAYYPFLQDLLARVPDRRLYYDEMDLIVIHSYHRAELTGIANLVTAYRGLPDQLRIQLRNWADRRLRAKLQAHAGGTAYGRYRRKIADLLVAFGTTTGLEYVAVAPEDRSYVQLV